MSYTATTDVNDMDATHPLGSEAPSILDDADRETRRVLKATVLNASTSKGARRMAIWKQVVTAAVPSGTINQWNRRALATIVDPTSLLSAGAFTNSILPILGQYLVRFWAVGYKLDGFQVRLAQATGNTTGPSAANEIADCLGNFSFSNNADATFSVAHGEGIITTDGTKSYCLDQRHAVLNATDGYGKAGTTGWAAVAGTNVVAVVEFDFLGAVVP